MQISDFTCRCGAEYERAESESSARSADPRGYRCSICDADLEHRDLAKLVAFRLVVPPTRPALPR
jgi:hypothetical protein